MKIILPYVPSLDERIATMLTLVSIKAGQKTMDLGAGDGRVVIAFAKKGAQAYGIEIRKKYARRAKFNILKEGLSQKASVTEADFWSEDISSYDIVTVYPMKALVQRLEEKFIKELKPGAIVITNGFPLPTWKPIKTGEHIYVYVKS